MPGSSDPATNPGKSIAKGFRTITVVLCNFSCTCASPRTASALKDFGCLKDKTGDFPGMEKSLNHNHADVHGPLDQGVNAHTHFGDMLCEYSKAR